MTEGKGDSKCKDPETGTCLVCLRTCRDCLRLTRDSVGKILRTVPAACGLLLLLMSFYPHDVKDKYHRIYLLFYFILFSVI